MLTSPQPNFVSYAANTVSARRVVIVSQLPGVTGDGSAANPYVGWAAAIGAGVDSTTYRFDENAVFQTAATFAPTALNTQYLGNNATIKYTGTGRIFSIDGRPALVEKTLIKIENFILDGNGTADIGLYLDLVHLSLVRNVYVRNMNPAGTTSTAFRFYFCVCLVLERLACSDGHDKLLRHSSTLTNMPYYGIVGGENQLWVSGTTYAIGDQVLTPNGSNYFYWYRLTAGAGTTTPASDPTNWRNDTAYPAALCAPVILAPQMEELRSHGIWLKNAFNISGSGGSSENNIGCGLRSESNCYDNVWNTDFENNTAGVFLDGRREILNNCVSSNSALWFGTNSRSCEVNRGIFTSLRDDGQRNTAGRVAGLAYAATTGTATDTYFIQENPFLHRLINPVVTSNQQFFTNSITIDDQSTAGNSAGVFVCKQSRTGHVQSWWTGLGITGLGSWALYDATGVSVKMEVLETGQGTVFTGRATNKGDVQILGSTTSVANQFPFQLNDSSGNILFTVNSYGPNNNIFQIASYSAFQMVGSNLRFGTNADLTINFYSQPTFNAQATFAVPPKLPSYTVALLPAAGTAGKMAYASNGRNPGQGAAAGTGCMVWDNGSAWIAASTGVAVTA